MTKDELRMTNNELEARVIELEAQLECQREETDEQETRANAAEQAHETLEQLMREEAAARPAEHFADWYKRLHPIAGGEPDAQVLAKSQYARIIA